MRDEDGALMSVIRPEDGCYKEWSDLLTRALIKAPSMEITEWLRDGNHSFKKQGLATVDEVLEAAGRLLDKACSGDIVGEIIFKGADGRTYVGTVEFVINEADPDYVREATEEAEDE